MAKKGILTVLAGLTVIGAAAGGALAYVKRNGKNKDFMEDDFDDLLDEDEEEVSAERNYTTLPTEEKEAGEADDAEEKAEEAPAEAAEETPEEATEEATEETAEKATEEAAEETPEEAAAEEAPEEEKKDETPVEE